MPRSLITYLSIAILVSACCRGPKQFDDPHGHYSVSVPGSPDEGYIISDPIGGKTMSVFTYETSSGGVQYVFGRGSMLTGNEGLTASDREQVVTDHLLEAHHGELDQDRKVVVEGHSGREIVIIGKTQKTAARIITMKDDFIYLQEITFRSDKYDQAEVDRYFGSWKFGPQAGDYGPQVDPGTIPDWMTEDRK